MEININNNLKVGLFFIIAGLIFAVETFFKVRILYKLWPTILIILGSGLINIFFIRKKRDVLFFGMGAYLILFSLLALCCNFSSWEYAGNLWPLFIRSAVAVVHTYSESSQRTFRIPAIASPIPDICLSGLLRYHDHDKLTP